MQLHLTIEALLRLSVGSQAWTKWQPDNPIFSTKPFATKPHNNDQLQRKKRTC
jgi:hypothetical protein